MAETRFIQALGLASRICAGVPSDQGRISRKTPCQLPAADTADPPRGAIIGKADWGVNPDRRNLSSNNCRTQEMVPGLKNSSPTNDQGRNCGPGLVHSIQTAVTSASDRVSRRHHHHRRRCAPEPH